MRCRCLLMLMIFFCLGTKPTLGQQEQNSIDGKEREQVLFYDTLKNRVNTPYTIIIQEGYIINYFYKTGDSLYNYNLIFVPANELTVPLVQSITEKAKVVNEKQPLSEHYLLSRKDISEFENIFKFSWVVMHYTGRERDSLSQLLGYNRRSLNWLFSEFGQYCPPTIQSKIHDSIGIVFNPFRIEGVFRLEAYNINSQMDHHTKISRYYEAVDYKRIAVYGRSVKCYLDCRFISPIFSQILAVEFKDERRMKR